MRVGLLTGGGDCPGLNAVIHAVVKKGILHYGDEFVGFTEGWRGVLDNTTIRRKVEGGIEKCIATLKANKIDALIALGGDDTQSVTNALVQAGVPGVGVPKT